MPLCNGPFQTQDKSPCIPSILLYPLWYMSCICFPYDTDICIWLSKIEQYLYFVIFQLTLSFPPTTVQIYPCNYNQCYPKAFADSPARKMQLAFVPKKFMNVRVGIVTIAITINQMQENMLVVTLKYLKRRLTNSVKIYIRDTAQAGPARLA